jgi:CHAD domain-containing protein
MVAKRTVPKEQNNSRIEAGMRPVSEAFRAALEQCVEGAEPEAVHKVRTNSRRLQAMIQSTTPAEAFGKLTKTRLRQLRKIRRAAGPVRDLDVQRKLLGDKLLKEWASGGQSHPLCEQARALDEWLEDRRAGYAQDMQRAISKPQQRWAELGALPTFALGGRAGTADAVAMESFARAAYARPHLDAENLHDFRKDVKKARYIAEAGSAEASSVSKALKRLQNAIGEWHDWLCLREDACEALGDDAPELKAALDAEVERHLASAISTAESMRGRLLGEWQAVKRPPARATTIRGRRTA